MPCIQLPHRYEDIISTQNLLAAWEEFVSGKRGRKDVQEFSRDLIGNVATLYRELAEGVYRHGGYEAFKISDPKPRDIHKARVRDRLLHHAIYRILYPFFDRSFISDSYSCRNGKGTHKAMARFCTYAGKVSRNNTRTCWVLKCDIRKFFASIDHAVLIAILSTYIGDERVLSLLTEVIGSFSTEWPTPGVGHSGAKGLPLGNLTSQLLVNIYMNEFDQFVKQKLRVKYYLRYADDFVLLSTDKRELVKTLPCMEAFLRERLKLTLHPNKVSLSTYASGVDFLGWIHFPRHRVLRTSTKRRMMKKLAEERTLARVASYLGMLSHGDAHQLHVIIEE